MEIVFSKTFERDLLYTVFLYLLILDIELKDSWLSHSRGSQYGLETKEYMESIIHYKNTIIEGQNTKEAC